MKWILTLCVLVVCRPPERGVGTGGGALDPGGNVGGGGAERLSGVSTGGTKAAGTTGRPGPGGGHDSPRTGTQLGLNWSELVCSDVILTTSLTFSTQRLISKSINVTMMPWNAELLQHLKWTEVENPNQISMNYFWKKKPRSEIDRGTVRTSLRSAHSGRGK